MAGTSTPPRNTSVSMTSAPKSYKTAPCNEVPATPKLDYKSYLMRERKQTQRYGGHGFARLLVEPTTYREALAFPDGDTWQSAILEEYRSLPEAGTWIVHDMSDLPTRRQPVGSNWVFKLNHNANGSIERYKA